jgi:ferric-dicitrate binding protein FerR (iron transport regulator)
MNDWEPVPEAVRSLIDAYLSGEIDAAGLAELEARLAADDSARRFFVRYAAMHTDLHLWARARRAGDRAIAALAAAGAGPSGRGAVRRQPGARRRAAVVRAGVAVAVLVAGAGVWSLVAFGLRGPASGGGPAGLDRARAVAWLVNAQDCQWADSAAAAGDLGPGKVLRIARGLAEFRFASGAHIVLEGPASLELVSSTSVRLGSGKAAVRVPEAARGFTVFSPQGRVVDLGTEFGVSVAADGSTELVVFEGEIEASPETKAPEVGPLRAVTLGALQAALLTSAGVLRRFDPQAAALPRFVRRIVPPRSIVPRTLRLDFRRPVDGTLEDASGAGTGFTHRLPGTGAGLAAKDANLRVHPTVGRLELVSTKSDLNTEYFLAQGEYLGVRLADLGFQGEEDFAVAVTIPEIPAMDYVGQFGLYAGTDSRKVIRGGLISRIEPESFTHFLVNNDGGIDTDIYTVGLLSPGHELRLVLRRAAGRYSLTVENETTGGSSTLAIRHPAYLDGARDLLVGLFAANPREEQQRKLVVEEFEVTVWASP